MSTTEELSEKRAWFGSSTPQKSSRPRRRSGAGLDAEEVERRLAQYGPNQLTTEPPPSMWSVALGQLSNPMNIMLVIVAVASIAIGQVATGIFVALLVTFNVVMGSRQELKARASVEALAAAPGAARSGAAIRPRRGDRVDRPGSRRRRAARGGRRRARPTGGSWPRRRSRCRRPRSPARARRSPRTDDAPGRRRSRSATARTSCSRTRRSRVGRRASW